MIRRENEEEPPRQEVTTTSKRMSLKSSTIITRVAEDKGDNGPYWDSLPNEILFEIFSYLPREIQIIASQVCRHWKSVLFHPRFWKKITFSLMDEKSIEWSRRFSINFQNSVQEVTIRCKSSNMFVQEALMVLKKLSSNRKLRKLFLEPTTCLFQHPTRHQNGKKLLDQLLTIIETSESLKTLSLGCIEELTKDLTCILEPLKIHQSKYLSHLSLASVKKNPNRYEFLKVECSVFSNFSKLTILAIDYEHVSDELLQALNTGLMERLIIHVHEQDREYIGASNDAWTDFTQKNPICKLRLNIIHSWNAVGVLDNEILQPGMPLTHLKVLFCKRVNFIAINKLSHWYSKTLQSLVWIDSFTFQMHLFNRDERRFFYLMVAVRQCKHLNEIVFIGQKYYLSDLLGIVSRSHNLKRLEFAESDSIYEEISDRKGIIDEIKRIMGIQWKLLSDTELPKVVINPQIGDNREVIMPMVLQDLK